MPTPFVISAFKTGLFSYYNPWIAPQDSVSSANNIVISNGIIRSRNGLQFNQDNYSYRITILDNTTITYSLPAVKVNSLEILFEESIFKQNKDGEFYRFSGIDDLEISITNNVITFVADIRYLHKPIFITFTPLLNLPIRGLVSFGDPNTDDTGLLTFTDKGLTLFIRGERQKPLKVKQLLFNINPQYDLYEWSMPIPFYRANFTVTIQLGDKTLTFTYKNGFSPSDFIQKLFFNNQNNLVVNLSNPAKKTGKVFVEFYAGYDIFSGRGEHIRYSTSKNLIAFCNTINRIGFFNIETLTLTFPDITITKDATTKPTNQIKTANHLKFFNNRLLLCSPTIINAENQNGTWFQSVRWSAPYLQDSDEYSFWNFTADTPGYGGEFSPDTNEEIIALSAVKDKLIAWFSESSYSVSTTSDMFLPFLFNKINNSQYADCPVSTTETEAHTQILGQSGYIQTNGIEVERIALKILGFTNKINFYFKNKIYSHRQIGITNYLITIYPSNKNRSEECDEAFMYNYIEDSFSYLSFHTVQPTSICTHKFSTKFVWRNMKNIPFNPVDAGHSFRYYSHYTTKKQTIFGSSTGALYFFTDDHDKLDEFSPPTPIPWSFKSSRLSPFINEGKSSFFHYIDIYFEGFDSPLNISMNIYINGRTKPAKSSDFSLQADKYTQTFKRIQLQVSAFFIELEFLNNTRLEEITPLKVLGFIIWADPTDDIKDCKYLTNTL